MCIKGRYIFLGPCRMEEAHHGDSICQYPYFLTQGGESLLGHCAGRQRESSAGSTRLPKFRSSAVPSDWPQPPRRSRFGSNAAYLRCNRRPSPSFYSSAHCICRYVHQQGSKWLFGGLYLIAKELCSVKQSGILQ